MSSAASSLRPRTGSASSYRRTVRAITFAVALAAGALWTDADDGFAMAIAPIPPAALSGAATAPPSRDEGAGDTNKVSITPGGVAPAPVAVNPAPVAPSATDEIVRTLKSALAGAQRRFDAVTENRDAALPKFSDAYRALRKLVDVMGLPAIQQAAAAARATVVGIASTYNPYRDGCEEGGAQTASGEFYDPAAWTAAIQIGLRGQFGGVRYGRLYQPVYALVESGDKQVIVKINDVGPLRPGRVIDLNERSMRYFDPFLKRGLISDVKITMLPGEHWTPGPVLGVPLKNFASAQ